MTSATIHASCISIGGQGVLIIGASGAGKSDLALRLIDRGAALISDDYTLVRAEDGHVVASPPSTIAGKMEIRGVGIVEMTYGAATRVALVVTLGGEVERLPDPEKTYQVAGINLATLSLAAHEASAPIKVEWALKQRGTTA